jgi:hypothetical protein
VPARAVAHLRSIKTVQRINNDPKAAVLGK